MWDPDKFARELLPTQFKHDNMASFVRQCNTYGFFKAAPSGRWEFANGAFMRGRRDLLPYIERKKSQGSTLVPCGGGGGDGGGGGCERPAPRAVATDRAPRGSSVFDASDALADRLADLEDVVAALQRDRGLLVAELATARADADAARDAARALEERVGAVGEVCVYLCACLMAGVGEQRV